MPESDDRYACLDAAPLAGRRGRGDAAWRRDRGQRPGRLRQRAWLAANRDSAARWCVPVFVMISGALLLTPNGRRRAPLLKPPRGADLRAAWTLFYLLWRTALDWIDDGRLDLSFWPRKLAHGEPYYHLWYRT